MFTSDPLHNKDVVNMAIRTVRACGWFVLLSLLLFGAGVLFSLSAIIAIFWGGWIFALKVLCTGIVMAIASYLIYTVAQSIAKESMDRAAKELKKQGDEL